MYIIILTYLWTYVHAQNGQQRDFVNLEAHPSMHDRRIKLKCDIKKVIFFTNLLFLFLFLLIEMEVLLNNTVFHH